MKRAFDDDALAADLIQDYEARIAALERMIGGQPLELKVAYPIQQWPLSLWAAGAFHIELPLIDRDFCFAPRAVRVEEDEQVVAFELTRCRRDRLARLAPCIATFLVRETGSVYAPAFYVIAAAIVTGVSCYALARPRSCRCAEPSRCGSAGRRRRVDPAGATVSAAMQLEDPTKSNLVTVLGLGLLTFVATELAPSLRPALKSAIKAGLSILEESEIEAEAELIRFLAVTTFAAIDEVLSRRDDEAKRRSAVRRRIRHFQRQARSRAQCWNADEHERYRCYRRHVAQLQAHLVEKKQQVGPRRQRIIDDASTFLAQEIG